MMFNALALTYAQMLSLNVRHFRDTLTEQIIGAAIQVHRDRSGL